MDDSQLKTFLPFMMMVEEVGSRSPKYIQQKYDMCVGSDKAYKLLDSKNLKKLINYITKWELSWLYTREEVIELQRLILDKVDFNNLYAKGE